MAAISLALIVTQIWLDLKLPEIMRDFTVILNTTGNTMGDVWINGARMILYTLIGIAFAITTGYLAARIAAGFSQRLRTMLYDKVDTFSMEEISRFSTASLITRSTNDITQVQMLIMMLLQMIVKAPITAALATSKIVGKGYEWSLITVVGVIIVVSLVALMLVFVFPKFRKMQILTDNITKVTREGLTGLRVIRAYSAEEYQESKFQRANDELTSTQLFTARANVIMSPMLMLTMSGLTLAINWIGAYMVNSALVPDRVEVFSNMIVFSSYVMQIVMSFMTLAMMFVVLPRAAVSAKRINEVIDTVPAVTEGQSIKGLDGKSGEVAFSHVSFKYPDAEEYVLKDITFTAKKGETVAFVGATGSGKSTLINLVPRFFDATEGEVTIDGINVKDYKFEVLFNKIGYVPQQAVMFRGTVESNVAFGDFSDVGYSLDDVKRAVRIAQGADFVEEMDGGYEADISQSGTNISGGQKQRLAIARAICRKPEIIIFDDSFSALDYKTDRVLRTALKKETAGVTCLIVAQRIGTIMDADRIIVLDEGTVVGSGKHKQLLKDCSVYKEIALSQLSEEELVS